MKRITIIALFLSSALYAQETTYGIKNNVYRNEMNPAFVSDGNYISMPLITGSASYSGSTLPLTMLTKGYGAGDIERLNGHESLNLNVNDNVISGGWHHGRNKGIFSTFSLTVNAVASYNVPKDVLRIANDYNGLTHMDINDIEPFSYDLSGASLSVTTAVRLSFGQSYKILDNLRIGYKVNASLLPGYADIKYDTFRLDYDGNKFSSVINGSCSFNGVQLPVQDGITQAKFPVSYHFLPGYELSFDIGAVYQPLDWIEVSASVSSLGFRNLTNTRDSFRASEYSADWDDLTYENYLQVYESINAELENLFTMPVSDKKREIKATPFVARTGCVITLPMLRMLSFSFLYRYENMNTIHCHDARWGVQLSPARWVDIALSYAYGTAGHQMGAMLLFKGKVANFMIATDSIPFRSTLPISGRLGLSFYLK